MFCPHCGQNNPPDSLFCTYCGACLNYDDNNSFRPTPPMNPYTPPQAPYPPYQYPPYPPMAPVKPKQTNPCAIAGFVLSLVSVFLPWFGFVCALLGVILSGVGISQSTRLDQDGKGFGIAGVIVSSFVLFFYVLVIILVAIGISVSI